MSEFKSILADEMNSFLSKYKQEVSKESYYHAERHLINFDEYLCSISCTDKNLTERQIYDWLGTFDVKKSTICKYVTTLRGLIRHLEGYGYRPFIPPYPKVRDDYIAYIFTDDELERIFSVADAGTGTSKYYPYRDVELPIILRILYGCGMRLGEVLSLKTENLNLEINGKVFDGTVDEVGYDDDKGNYIVIVDKDGWKALYSHLQEAPTLAKGDSVKLKDVIGKAGNTGKSTGPHLHFELTNPDGNVEPPILICGDE